MRDRNQVIYMGTNRYHKTNESHSSRSAQTAFRYLRRGNAENFGLDESIFAAGLLIPASFWFLDATAYFYQVKLRGTMEAIRQRLAARGISPLISVNGAAVIAPERVST